jgi:hypothetical protein
MEMALRSPPVCRNPKAPAVPVHPVKITASHEKPALSKVAGFCIS